MNENKKIIKYDNTFNKTSLSLLTKVQSDVLLAVLSKMGKETNDNDCFVATFDFSEIRNILNLKNLHTSRIKKSFDTLLETKVEFFTESTYEKGNLFSHYAINDKNKAEIVLTKNMSDKLIPNANKFTILDLNEYVMLPTNYSKEMYRLLRQFRYSGIKIIKKDDFIKMLKPPKSYDEYNIVRKVILPAMEENKIHFENLKINVNSKGTLPNVVKLTFKPHVRMDYKKEKADMSEEELLEYVKANSNQL